MRKMEKEELGGGMEENRTYEELQKDFNTLATLLANTMAHSEYMSYVFGKNIHTDWFNKLKINDESLKSKLSEKGYYELTGKKKALLDLMEGKYDKRM